MGFIVKEQVERKQIHWRLYSNINFNASFDIDEDWTGKIYLERSYRILNYLYKSIWIAVIGI